MDAKARGCFYDAKDDKSLAQAVAGAMDVELNQLVALLKSDSPIFRNAKWKVYDTPSFSSLFKHDFKILCWKFF